MQKQIKSIIYFEYIKVMHVNLIKKIHKQYKTHINLYFSIINVQLRLKT